MFFQFGVDESHCNLLRFLWFNSDDPKGEPQEYRMKVHLFGAASSPACVNFGLKQTAADFEEEFGSETANFVRNDVYIDDGLKSVPSPKEAVDLITKSRAMCQKGGLHLHKFLSNCREVIASIPPGDRAQGQTADQKRNFVDHLYTIPLDSLLRLCSRESRFYNNFARRKQNGTLTYLPISDRSRNNGRPVFTYWKVQKFRDASSRQSLVRLEPQSCSDASSTGYGLCTYPRLTDDEGRVHNSLVMGIFRVAPLKTDTIPRLTVTLVSIRVSNFLDHELEIENIRNIFWTDSKTVLGYLSNDSRRFHVFVSNRVEEIRNHSDPSQWRYVRTDENPADEGSRGLTAQDFVKKFDVTHMT